MHAWTRITPRDLAIERAQCGDEGKDLGALEAEFDALAIEELPADPELQARAGALLDRTLALPVREGYEFVEPSAPDAIRAQRGAPVELPPAPADRAVLLDKAHGAWTGRCAGCLLGTGVEGRRRGEIQAYLASQGRWPLADWFSNAAEEAVRQQCRFPAPDHPFYAENITCMVEDDDTNYTAVGLALMRRHGGDLAPAHVADFWLGNLPFLHVCTAERVAYRNLVNGLPAPGPDGEVDGALSSATFRNVYREWIGAQIRGDFFGYCRPGAPEAAAELAWRDACISHVKNGIYGEMWVAAMLAAACGSGDVETVIRAGLAQIPARSRLRRDVETVLAWRDDGRSYFDAVDAVHARWDEGFRHHWCHTNSNAQIVALALLWGEMDFGRTLCAAVMPGFDTDCNGATAGSVLGLMLGRRALPAHWAEPLRDTLITGVHGYHKVKLERMAAETVELMR